MRIIFFLFLFSSCSRISQRTIDHSITFNENATFALADNDDSIGTIKDLRNILITEGINFTYQQNARNAIKYKTQLKDSDINKELERAFNIKDINSVYIIVLDYHYFKNLGHYSYDNFKYSIIDLNTNKTIIWGYSKILPENKHTETLKVLVKRIKSMISPKSKS